MSLEALDNLSRSHSLEIFGVCHTSPDDGLGEGTLALLGPREPGFWPHVQAAPEFQDGNPDPLDRWSRRIISNLARDVGGNSLFPFGTPVRPFVSWALRSATSWVSPVGLLVHKDAGLFVSYRGAVLFDSVFALPTPFQKPCETCLTQNCLSACPVGALTAKGYELSTCHGFLDGPDGDDCMSNGCKVRRCCPVSQDYGRQPEQSAFHMASFHPGNAHKQSC